MTPRAKTVSETVMQMSQVMEPGDANFHGNVFGGTILSMIDLLAYTTSARFAGNVTVTASFDRVDFIESIEVGEVVTMSAHISYVGRTSMDVTIDVWAESIITQKKRHTNTARVTMVALKDGKPAEVPRLICETRDDKIQFLAGRLRRERRSASRTAYDELSKRLERATDEELDQMLTGGGPTG